MTDGKEETKKRMVVRKPRREAWPAEGEDKGSRVLDCGCTKEASGPKATGTSTTMVIKTRRKQVLGDY